MTQIAEKASEVNYVGPAIQAAISDGILRDAASLIGGDGRALGEYLDRAVVQGIEHATGVLAQRYAAEVLGAERSTRVDRRAGYRSGSRSIRVGSPFGLLEISLVKSRCRLLRPPFLQNAQRFTEGMRILARKLWTSGLSYRSISEVSKESLGGQASHATVGTWVHEAHDEVMRWLNRPIDPKFKYLVLDGMYISVKRHSARNEVVLVALGITESGEREVLDVMAAPNESLESWRMLLARLKGRGLNPGDLSLTISDGCEGLIGAIQTELPGVARQRCTVHKVRNVLGTAPLAIKSEATKKASAIWRAPNKSEARKRAKEFIEVYSVSHPKVAAIVQADFEATLAFTTWTRPRGAASNRRTSSSVLIARCGASSTTWALAKAIYRSPGPLQWLA